MERKDVVAKVREQAEIAMLSELNTLNADDFKLDIIQNIEKTRAQVVWKILGMDNRWGKWEIDHCNGRTSPLSEFLTEQIREPLQEWLAEAAREVFEEERATAKMKLKQAVKQEIKTRLSRANYEEVQRIVANFVHEIVEEVKLELTTDILPEIPAEELRAAAELRERRPSASLTQVK